MKNIEIILMAVSVFVVVFSLHFIVNSLNERLEARINTDYALTWCEQVKGYKVCSGATCEECLKDFREAMNYTEEEFPDIC